LTKIGDNVLEGYLQELFQFTIESYQTGNQAIHLYAAVLNQVWQRILTESISMSVPCQNKIEGIITQVISTFLQENLKLVEFGSKQTDEEEEEEENFSKYERTVKNENLDFFAKLMKSKVEESCTLIISLFNQLIMQY